jgi:hypothetical protein
MFMNRAGFMVSHANPLEMPASRTEESVLRMEMEMKA